MPFSDAPEITATWVQVQVCVPDRIRSRRHRIYGDRIATNDVVEALPVRAAEPYLILSNGPGPSAILVNIRCHAEVLWYDILPTVLRRPADEHVAAVRASLDPEHSFRHYPDGVI